MKLDRHYTDPRLVELYDIENPRGPDTDFYVGLATDLNAARILDLGCGTGLLTRELAVGGRLVVGVDPSRAMLAVARRGPNADRVRWVEGYSDALGTAGADLALMTGNVAQVFLEDHEWYTALRNVNAALRTGGYLTFESRNPEVRAWGQWNREATYRRFDSPHGPVESWLELLGVNGEYVRFESYTVFAASDEVTVTSSELRFRSLTKLTDSLTDTGFAIEHAYGDWSRGPVTDTSRVMVFVARSIR